ncbi:MAG: DUF2635 domain-containing protein [Deltaproteobacteria bacterium]|jgi:hypothetical protein|nr:DUF2635 domain-containing protein [Deltaproteobacteria bacterium]
MFLKPSQVRLLVMDPQRKSYLPPEGREVEPSVYWTRQLKAGTVKVVSKEAEEPESPPAPAGGPADAPAPREAPDEPPAEEPSAEEPSDEEPPDEEPPAEEPPAEEPQLVEKPSFEFVEVAEERPKKAKKGAK